MTDKQKRFCQEYVIDWNATRAAIAAGYSENTAYVIGYENLQKKYLRDYIEALKPDKGSMIRSLKKERDSDDGHIYIFKCEGFNFYKIGKTKRNVQKRLSGLQVGLPFDISVYKYWKFENHSDVEVKIHAKFKRFLIRGEWFSFNETILSEVVAYVDSLEPVVTGQQIKMAI